MTANSDRPGRNPREPANTYRYIRPAFLNPGRALTDDLITDVLSLVGLKPPPGRLAAWTKLDRLAVYDYAIREHLSASDSLVKRRPRPALLDCCEIA